MGLIANLLFTLCIDFSNGLYSNIEHKTPNGNIANYHLFIDYFIDGKGIDNDFDLQFKEMT